MNKILVTPRSVSKNGHPSLDKLKAAGYEVAVCTPGQQPSEQDLLTALPNCVGMLAGVEPISEKALQAGKNLRAISRNGVGVNNIDLAAAEKLGIKILNTPGANARGVAELTWALILAVARSVPYGDMSLKSAKWQRQKGIELQGRTLGLIGCGSIGKLVARFGLAFDMKVLACDPYPDESFARGQDFSYVRMDQVLAESDIISLHCPVGQGNSPLINAQAIAKTRPGVYLINTARAQLLDDSAVVRALDSGQIAAVATDVFEPEPPTDWTLAKHPKVVATAHIGGFTTESVDRAVDMAVENLINALK